MLEYRPIGVLSGAASESTLVLPTGRPLSYLRVAASPDRSVGLTRALLENRASEFRLRIPLVTDVDTGRTRVAKALERFNVSAVYPVLEGRCLENDLAVEVCWLDWIQMKAVGLEMGAGFRKRADAIAVGGLEISPAWESAPTGAEELKRDWQYWNSNWELASPPSERADWWRVRPNETRDRRALVPRLRRPEPGAGPQARGAFAACLHPEMRRKLGNPRYVVIRHPFRKGWLPVLALTLKGDFGGKEGGEDLWGNTIFLDRTARDALGIADGEFCFVYPWLRPRRSILWQEMRDRAVGSRMIAAHARAPARADLEKPACRLEPAALEAIGGRAGEFVTIEHLTPPRGEKPSERWERVHMSQRVLPIDTTERAERVKWEAPQLWDDRSNPSPDSREAPELEGYVDCAERLGVHPPYPSIYLNYYTRHGLRKLGLCQPVQVRVGVPGRLIAEASEFAWLVVIALLGAVIVFLPSTKWQIIAAALLALATAGLVVFRAIRAIR